MVAPLVVMNGRTDGGVPWSRALDDPDALLEGDPVLVYLCRPNNPTGHQAPDGWMDALLESVESRGPGAPLVVVDEAYAEFAGTTLLDRAPEHPRLLVSRTLSKAFGLAGLRVGWGAGCTTVVDEVEKARGPYKVSKVSEAAAVAALEDDSGWVEETVRACVTNRTRLRGELEARELAPFPSRSNFLLFPVTRGTARPLALALREHGVAVRPFADDEEVGDALRVTVGPWPLMERFLEALDAERDADPEAWQCPDADARRTRLAGHLGSDDAPTPAGASSASPSPGEVP
jgi:histidinol-phosphate/aromatic aminotransferase/cobyric acid decarboxylase-like protein